ncbi:hypothetical protein Pcinc_039021 [Petrolisthes cinctipes]|uniref:Uncharacterized protein n=1 Tax=Petrolisthes cinctipes TaxID=88211 RepID=A0AAE1BQ95_PETCI|nr:hypothetical protein Pcinc_039021 [Petrolisthes cinctipes]
MNTDHQPDPDHPPNPHLDVTHRHGKTLKYGKARQQGKKRSVKERRKLKVKRGGGEGRIVSKGKRWEGKLGHETRVKKRKKELGDRRREDGRREKDTWGTKKMDGNRMEIVDKEEWYWTENGINKDKDLIHTEEKMMRERIRDSGW